MRHVDINPVNVPKFISINGMYRGGAGITGVCRNVKVTDYITTALGRNRWMKVLRRFETSSGNNELVSAVLSSPMSLSAVSDVLTN